MSIIIIKTFIFTLLFSLSFPAHSPAPQLGSDDSLSPSLSPPPSAPADTPSPADAPFAENVKSEERKESGSGGTVVGVVAAVCVVGLGHLVLQNIRRSADNHHINQPNPQGNMADNHHINQPNPGYVFVMGRSLNDVYEYYLINDDNAFPENRVILHPMPALQQLANIRLLGNINRYQCFYGDVNAETKRAVMWNPRWHLEGEVGMQFVSIDIPIINPGYTPRVGFGVCPRTGDTKLFKFDFDIFGRPQVELFTIDTMLGAHVSIIVPVGSRIWDRICFWRRIRRDFESAKFCENGVIYFRAYDNIFMGLGVRSNFFVSFDLVTEKFGELPLPWSLPSTGNFIQSVNVNGSLGLLKYQDGSCDVWTKREGANGTFFQGICNFYGVYETFTKIRTIRVEGHYLPGGAVLGFRNNGDAIIELDINNEVSRIVVYEQGHIRDVGIHGRQRAFSVRQL